MSSTRPVILVHGMGSNFEHNWRRHGWVDMLEAADREVFGFDMPGHGTADPLAPNAEEVGDCGVQRLIAFCEEILSTSPATQVDIVGFSAGSVLTLTTAVRRPELFGRIALLGLADAQLLISVESMRAGASDLTSTVMRTVQVAAERAGNNVASVLDWAQRSDPPPSFADLHRVSAPVLLVLGEQDFLGDPDRVMEALPQVRLVTLPDTDHFSTTSRFEAKLVVTDFLTSAHD